MPWPHMLSLVPWTIYPELSRTRQSSEVSLSKERSVHPALRNCKSSRNLGQLESRLSNSPELPEPVFIHPCVQGSCLRGEAKQVFEPSLITPYVTQTSSVHNSKISADFLESPIDRETHASTLGLGSLIYCFWKTHGISHISISLIF